MASIPEKYWVRSGTHVLDDGAGWLPTFGPQARELREARFHRVTVDSDTPDADIYPEPGRLFRIGGEIQCEEDGPVTVTLSSESDRREIQTRCGPYRFDGVAPAYYEIHARKHNSPGAGFVELYLDRDNDSLNLQVLPTPHVRIEVRRESPNSLLLVPLKIMARPTGACRPAMKWRLAAPVSARVAPFEPSIWKVTGSRSISVACVRNPRLIG
ncbi:MAG: hypothetical protein ACK5AZ_13560 [Bryobacteraceae bacterium]